MSAHDQKAMSRRALEMWTSQDPARPEDIFVKNYVNHQEPNVHGGSPELSMDAWKDLLGEFRKAFSSRKIRIPMQIAEGDLVASRLRRDPRAASHRRDDGIVRPSVAGNGEPALTTSDAPT